MANTSTAVRVLNPSIDMIGERIIYRGKLDNATLEHVLTDIYQRGVLNGSKVDSLTRAVIAGMTPDIILGMRGSRMREKGDGLLDLLDDTYVIDGLQRLSAAKAVMQFDENECAEWGIPFGTEPHLGAIVYFGTDFDFENRLFLDLNKGQTKVTGDKILWNMMPYHRVLKVLFGLAENEKTFPLYGVVNFDQNMARNKFIHAGVYLRAIGMLHSHIGPGQGSNADELVRGLNIIMKEVGEKQLKENVRLFFESIDAWWHIHQLNYGDKANFMKNNFLKALARVLSMLFNFWEGNALVIPKPYALRFNDFKTGGERVTEYAGGGRDGELRLAEMILAHISLGQRGNNKPRPRAALLSAPASINGGTEDGDE